jgi:signal transduction histidine kinase
MLNFRAKTILGILIIESLLVAVLVTTHLGELRQLVEKEANLRARSTLGLLETAALDAILSEDLATLYQLADDAMQDPHITHLNFYGIDGQQLVSRGDSEPSELEAVADRVLLDEHGLHAARVIKVTGEQVGVVDLGMSMEWGEELIAEARTRGISIGVAGMALSCLFSFLLGTHLTHQLKRLVGAVRQLTERGAGAQVQVRGQDELAELARAFNEMSTELAEEHERLHKLNRTLSEESRVRAAAERALRQHRDQLETMVEAQTLHLSKALFKAQEGSRAKSEFLANMSHELRTPLHAITSFSRLGQRKSDEAERAKLREYFDRIDESSRRLLVLLDNLLDLSRMEAGQMPFELSVENAGDLMRAVSDELETLASERDQRLMLLVADEPLPLACDAGQIGRMLTNLIGNAIKYSGDGGDIELSVRSARRDGHYGIEFRVADHGLGLPAAEIGTLFDKFTQSSLTRSSAGGTGLGLAICREIVSAHGGEISAENRAGGGACFRVWLPRDQADLSVIPSRARA